MATSEGEVGLKHLGFVKVLAINAVFVVLKLSGFAKYMSGPLKSTVGKVEGAVTAVMGPLYNAFKPLFSYILLFLDKKVDVASYIFDKYAPRIVKSVISKTLSIVKKALHLMQGANGMGPVVAISHAGNISKKAFDEHTPPIVKDIVSKTASMVKKTSDLVLEGPVHAANSNAGKISKKSSPIFDTGALSIAKGVGSMVKKTSDLVVEGPIATISYADKISEKASNIFDEHAPSIAKDVVSKAGSMVDKASNLVQEAATKGPFEAISQVGEMSKEFAVRQMVMVWYKANQDSFLSGILEILLPIVVYLLDKYNHLVKYLKGKGWSSLFSYIPLIPLEEMEKTIKQVEEAIVDARRSSKNGSKSK